MAEARLYVKIEFGTRYCIGRGGWPQAGASSSGRALPVGGFGRILPL